MPGSADFEGAAVKIAERSTRRPGPSGERAGRGHEVSRGRDRSPSGLHARPAAALVRAAAGFRSRIRLENANLAKPPVDAKSLTSILGAGVENGHRVRFWAEGEDEVQAIAALRDPRPPGRRSPGPPFLRWLLRATLTHQQVRSLRCSSPPWPVLVEPAVCGA
jgi:phosphotransferase system HPr (HPr) family protein